MEIEQLLHKYNDYIQSLPAEHTLTAINFIVNNSDCDLETIKKHVKIHHA